MLAKALKAFLPDSIAIKIPAGVNPAGEGGKDNFRDGQFWENRSCVPSSPPGRNRLTRSPSPHS